MRDSTCTTSVWNGFVIDSSLQKYIREPVELGFGVLYSLIDIDTDRAYIGKTSSRKHGAIDRYRCHYRGTKRSVSLINRALKKHGAAKFAFVILSKHPIAELNDAEKAAIAQHGTVSPGGYNLRSGGEGGSEMHESSIKKLKQTVADPQWRADWLPKLRAAHTKEVDQRRVASFKSTVNAPGGNTKLKSAAAARMKNVDIQAKRKASFAVTMLKPDSKKAMSDSRKAAWEDPEYRLKQQETRKAQVASGEYGKRMRETGKKSQTEASKAKRLKSLTTTLQSKKHAYCTIVRSTALPYVCKLQDRVQGAFYVRRDGVSIGRASGKNLRFVCSIE